jgi:hypothetical protein
MLPVNLNHGKKPSYVKRKEADGIPYLCGKQTNLQQCILSTSNVAMILRMWINVC